MKASSLHYVGDKQIQNLLLAHSCPTPFHTVRTRFLGNIATPRLGVSPLEIIKELWGGELPEFGEIGDANALLKGLLSFWNHLAKHQSRSKPFRLVRVPLEVARDSLREFCQTRTEELEGFVDGLFGSDELIDLPERAVEGMEHLGEINAMVRGVLRLLDDPDQSPTDRDLGDTLRNVKELTSIAEIEMHAVILSCVHARREGIGKSGKRRPTMH